MAAKISDDELLFAYLTDYLDDSLDPELLRRMEELVKRQSDNFMGDFLQAKGRLQLEFQPFDLTPVQIEFLNSYVAPTEARQKAENKEIDFVGKREILDRVIRSIAFLGIFIGAAYVLNSLLAPIPSRNFEAISYLGYEALAIERSPNIRISFPSHDLGEIRDFLTSDKSSEVPFQPPFSFGSEWQPEGAGIINYEIAKVAMITLTNSTNHEHLFYFSYPDRIENIKKKKEAGKLGDNFEYFVFASDEMNIVVWQQTPQLLSFLIGHRSAPELAKLAQNSSQNDPVSK